ncbi:MAG: DEAD/DEAH box helicase [Anaerolineae bacterium]
MSAVQEFETRYPFPLDPFQREAIQYLAHDQSVFVAAPTGTGKTVVAEYAVWSALAAGRRVVYTTPLKALSNQKFRDFRAQYGVERVGLMTGDLVENPTAPLVVMTTEVYRNMLLQGDEADIAYVIFDEVHYLADPERGTAWEEAIILAPPSVCLVCLSATVPNAVEIAAWLSALRGDVALIQSEHRVVPLEYQYFVDDEMKLLVSSDGRIRLRERIGGELARNQRGGWVPRANGSEGHGKPHPIPTPLEIINALDAMDRLPALYFLFSRKLVEDAAATCKTLPRVPHADELVAAFDERIAALDKADRSIKQVADLRALLPFGVAFHHAGILPILKVFVEEHFAANRLRAVFATDTLALGVNMPARTVIIGEASKFDGERRRMLLPNELRQMAGRAGRRGLDTLGTVVIPYSPLVSATRMADLATAELLPLESAFAPGYNALVNLWQEDIGDRLMVDLTASSLKRFQRDDDMLEAAVARFKVAQRVEQLKLRPDYDDARARRYFDRMEDLDGEIDQAGYRARRGARRFVRRLEQVLGQFGYFMHNRLTERAKWLARIFDTNSLTLAEMLRRHVLDDLPSEEVAEVVSWFAFDRELLSTPDVPWTTSLARARRTVFDIHSEVLQAEATADVAVSTFLSESFAGPALLWAQGAPLPQAAALVGLAEGDIIQGLQKTIDLLGQLRQAVRHAEPENIVLRDRLRDAESCIRRGIVEYAYQLILAPESDEESALTPGPSPNGVEGE